MTENAKSNFEQLETDLWAAAEPPVVVKASPGKTTVGELILAYQKCADWRVHFAMAVWRRGNLIPPAEVQLIRGLPLCYRFASASATEEVVKDC